MPGIGIDEVLKMRRERLADDVVASLDLAGDIPGDVLRPVLGGVETHHPDRVAVLPRDQVLNGGLEIGLLDVGFPIYPADPTERP